MRSGEYIEIFVSFTLYKVYFVLDSLPRLDSSLLVGSEISAGLPLTRAAARMPPTPSVQESLVVFEVWRLLVDQIEFFCQFIPRHFPFCPPATPHTDMVPLVSVRK